MFKTGDLWDGTYQIIKEIGRGGGGIVYLAFHLRLRKYVVVKKIKQNYVGALNSRGEVDILKNLHHKYLPQVYDFIQIGSEVYTIMDYISGADLSKYMAEGVRFEEGQLILWLKQLCEVLEYLHTQTPPILHLDIKPGNIIITDTGDICLIDFNISLGEEDTTQIFGLSKAYASPEQWAKWQEWINHRTCGSVRLDARSDIYSLGATFYHLLTGVCPTAELEKLVPIRQLECDCQPGLKEIIAKAMEVSPKRRYFSAAKMGEALMHVSKQDLRYRRMNRWIAVSTAIYLLIAAIGMIGIYKGNQEIIRGEFVNEYQQAAEQADAMDYKTAGRTAERMLNNSKYRRIFQQDGQLQANVLYLLSQECMEEGEYQEAVGYLEECTEYDTENPVYYRDMAIALVRGEAPEKAGRILRKAKRKGLSGAELCLVQGEVSMQEGDYDAAAETLKEAVREAPSSEVSERAAVLCARCLEDTGRKREAAALLKECCEAVREPGSKILREYMELCIDLGDTLEGKEKRIFYAEALSCGEELAGRSYTSLSDKLNLAVLYGRNNEWEKGERWLLAMSRDYPEEYGVYRELALYYVHWEQRKEESKRDFRKAEKAYRQAGKYFNESSGSEDVRMQELEQMMERLYESGWLVR